MRAHRRLRIRASLLVLAGALAVAGGIGLLLGNTAGLRASAQTTLKADTYLLDVVQVERLIVDAETGLRGYVLTARPVFLQPLDAARGALPGAYAALRHAATADGHFTAQTAALIASAQAYMSGYVPRLLGLAVADLASARSYANALAGKQRVDAIRRQTASLEALVSNRESASARTARASANRGITEAIVLLVVLSGLTALLGGVLAHLAVQRELARERAEATTATLQRSILPDRLPALPGFEIGVHFAPAGDGMVGGDFYDVFELSPGRWALIVGDVCGKGAAAAAVSAMARWTLRSLTGADVTPSDALRFLNRAFQRHGFEARYVTVAYLLLVVGGEERARATIACAGHPPPVVVPHDGAPRAVEAAGDLIGVWPEVALEIAEVELRPGDAIVAFTDGVTEQGPGVEVSVLDVLAGAGRHAGAGALADRLAHSVQRAPPRDDLAVLAARFLGTPARMRIEPEAPHVP